MLVKSLIFDNNVIKCLKVKRQVKQPWACGGNMGCKEVADHVSRAYCEWSWGGRQRWREAPWRPVYHTRVWRNFFALRLGSWLMQKLWQTRSRSDNAGEPNYSSGWTGGCWRERSEERAKRTKLPTVQRELLWRLTKAWQRAWQAFEKTRRAI